ncbi:class I SAM-dependent methyltransferase [Bauldia sp.]|uniref:class I SAM-dependent methyltransferase n=1 Tax=Bauldia sp. TaxID=2575872 RepID=UPI003BAA73C3
MTVLESAILDHHKPAARMWGIGGAAYDNVSFRISDALAHAAQRLAPRPGDRVLDVATGTGWTARNLARVGAEVTAIDIAPELLAAAEALSKDLDRPIDYRLADAERLPFADGAFDGVISTFGVMFAVNHERAATEIARVCRPGGRLSLACWAPAGAVAEFFGVIGKHSGAPPPEPSPLAWGDRDIVAGLLGRDFDLTFEMGISNAYHADPDEIWDWYVEGFGPLKQLAASLDEPARTALKADVDAYHRHYATDLGLHIKREYLVIVGKRLG